MPAAVATPRKMSIPIVAIGFTLALGAVAYAFANELGTRAVVAQVPSPAFVAASSSQGAPMLELHIANDGLTLLRGAQITAISGNTITAKSAWGASDFIWTVETNPATKFFDDNGNTISASALQAGESVTITGNLDEGASQPTIDAQFIRTSP